MNKIMDNFFSLWYNLHNNTSLAFAAEAIALCSNPSRFNP